METAATKIARLDRSIARTGETVTLQRTATDGSGAVTVAMQLTNCPAHVRASAPQDLLDPGVKEMRVIISSTHLLAEVMGSPAMAFGIPQRDDRLLIQGDPSNVQEVAPIYYGGALVRVNLLCRG
jgi:hypothetical protein